MRDISRKLIAAFFLVCFDDEKGYEQKNPAI